jgi:hypothetical protein
VLGDPQAWPNQTRNSRISVAFYGRTLSGEQIEALSVAKRGGLSLATQIKSLEEDSDEKNVSGGRSVVPLSQHGFGSKDAAEVDRGLGRLQ